MQENSNRQENPMAVAKRSLMENSVGLVVISPRQQIKTFTLPGVKGLLDILKTNPELLRQAVVGDKIVGRASALLLAFGAVQQVYTPVLSRGGKDILDLYAISYQYESLVEQIDNRNKTDMCPMEKLVLMVQDPKVGYEMLEAKIYGN